MPTTDPAGVAAARLRQKATSGNNNNYRFLLSGVAVAVLAQKLFSIRDFLPWGGPIVPQEGRGEFARINYDGDDLLMFHHGRTKLLKGRGETQALIQGPETVVIRPTDGAIFLLTQEGFLVSMTDIIKQHDDDAEDNILTGHATIVRDLGNGRPLGGVFAANGKTLYIADAVVGLLRISDIDDPQSVMEIVASSVVDDLDGTLHKLRYVDDVVMGPKTGKVYFTDASEIRPDILGQAVPDTMYASKVDFIRGIPTGRVLEYDPSTKQVTVLADKIHFANGISVDKDETFLVFAETFGPRVLKYHLQGPKAGTVETVVDRKDMMGYPDGVDCNHATGKCYAVLPSSIVPAHKLLVSPLVPTAVEWVLRHLLLLLPRQLAPPVKSFGGLLEFDPTTSTKTTQHRYILDPKGKDIGMLTGVTSYNNQLYLGSLHNTFIGVYSLLEQEGEESNNNDNDNNKE